MSAIIDKIEKDLDDVGYYPTKEISYAVMAATTCGKPLLIEGVPRAGKTSLAKAIAAMLDLPFIIDEYKKASLERKTLRKVEKSLKKS